MGTAAYRRSYRRARKGGGVRAAAYLFNPASHLTDQGADPDPADLGWCICRRWRVIYYSARYAAGLPLWPGVDDFVVLMTDVLFRLSSGFEPIAPLRAPKAPLPEDRPIDPRKDRVYQPCGRIFRTPVLDERELVD
jgi:hypothetical protein